MSASKSEICPYCRKLSFHEEYCWDCPKPEEEPGFLSTDPFGPFYDPSINNSIHGHPWSSNLSYQSSSSLPYQLPSNNTPYYQPLSGQQSNEPHQSPSDPHYQLRSGPPSRGPPSRGQQLNKPPYRPLNYPRYSPPNNSPSRDSPSRGPPLNNSPYQPSYPPPNYDQHLNQSITSILQVSTNPDNNDPIHKLGMNDGRRRRRNPSERSKDRQSITTASDNLQTYSTPAPNNKRQRQEERTTPKYPYSRG